jgi:hypothetical protein
MLSLLQGQGGLSECGPEHLHKEQQTKFDNNSRKDKQQFTRATQT